jgi:type III pantothenate kinase
MNLLLIDAGNTRIKWAIAAPGAALGAWTLTDAVSHAGLDGAADTWRRAGVARAIVSNVAGAAVRERIAQALPTGIAVEWFASSAERAGLQNGYRNPGQLGCDRFAAAIGARALAPGQDLIVATCGTATTVDAVTKDGRFIGGMILPGLALMAGSLARNTAQLPQVSPGEGPGGAAPPPLFGDNTDDAIVSGVLSAQAGAIERACAAHAATACIVSGGAAPYIAPVLKFSCLLVDNIVLVGLHAAAA